MGKLITSIICFIICIICVIISIMKLMEKGIPLNNEYSKKQQENKDKILLNRHSSIILILLAILFLVIGLECLSNSPELIASIVCFIICIICLIISIMQFIEKGIPLNNEYIWSSKNQREDMDKKPLYRQAAIIFILFAVLFLIIGLECLLKTDWLWSFVWIITILIIMYAVISPTKK